MRQWAVRRARWLKALYEGLEWLLVNADPLLRRIGYARLDHRLSGSDGLDSVDEAIEQLRIAERLDPFGLHWIPWIKCSVLFMAKRYEESIATFETMVRPPNEARYIAAAAYARIGRIDEAGKQLRLFLDRAREEMPAFPGERARDLKPLFSRMLDVEQPEDLDYLMESLHIAGLE